MSPQTSLGKEQALELDHSDTLSELESTNSLLDHERQTGGALPKGSSRFGFRSCSSCRLLPWFSLGILLTASLTFLSLAVYISQKAPPTMYPVVGLGMVEIDFKLDNKPAQEKSTKAFLAQLAKPYVSSYLGPPRGSLDATWRRITAVEGIPVSNEVMRKVDTEFISTLPADLQNTDDIMVEDSAYHQLHCLNFLRQQVFRNHYFGWSPSFGPEGLRKNCQDHMKHCLEMMDHYLLYNDYETVKDKVDFEELNKCPSYEDYS